MSDLPTIEQCQEFLATINRGREAVDLDPLEVLDFDGATPDSCANCLSARNLFVPSGGDAIVCVTDSAVFGADSRLFGLVLSFDGRLPNTITDVTRAFDAAHSDGELLAALRQRLVDAGVVSP